MADVKRGERPLSPHLQIYKPQWTWVPSITHRVTGVGLAVAALLVVWWLLALAVGGRDYFVTVDGLLTSWVGIIVWIGSAWALAYHFLNGLRHLWWDSGNGFEIDFVEKSAMATVAGSVVLAVVLILIA